MPFSTLGPLFSRIVYGRGLRSYRLPCFVAALLLLPLGMLFFYAISEPSPSGSSQASFGSGSRINDPKINRHFGNNPDEQLVEKRPLPTRDPILDRLVMAKSIRTADAIPDTRPNDCIASSSEDSPPALEHIRDRMPSIRTTIVLYPDAKHASLVDYELTLSSLLSTTDSFYEKLEIALVVNEFLTNDVVKYLEQVKESKMPIFYMVQPKKTRKTLFHELLELGQQLRGDILVYLASGLECNVGWLEAMIMPLMGQPPHQNDPKTVTSKSSQAHDLIRLLQPVIVTPHFDRLRKLGDSELRYEPENEFVRLLFHWNVKPMWYEMSFEELLHRNSEAEEIGTPAFLTHAFAVNKTSPLYAKLYAHFEKRTNDDTTTFEAAQFIWRCLNGAVVIAPCARIGSPNVYTQAEFDPRLVPGKDEQTKKRIIETWFDDFRPLALRLINTDIIAEGGKIEGEISSENQPPEGCTQSFFWFLETIAKEVVVPEEHIAFGWLKSGGGACFRAAIEHRLLGGSCTVLSDAHIFFLEKDGSIRTRTGLCMSAPDQYSYIELVECDQKDTKQHWIYSGNGMIKSAVRERCAMHATDPDEEKKARQILMMYNCTHQDDKSYGPFQKFSFTYKIV